MKNFTGGKTAKRVLLCLGGAAGGVINGLLGSGAGIVLIYLLGALYPEKDGREVFVISLSTVFFLTLCSAVFYGFGGAISFREFLPFVAPAAAGGFFGSVLLSKMKPNVLKKVFSALLIISGFLMLR